MNKQSMNYKCYAILCGDYKAKNIFEKIYYIVWKSLGVSPLGLQCHLIDKSKGEWQYYDAKSEVDDEGIRHITAIESEPNFNNTDDVICLKNTIKNNKKYQ